MPLSSPAVATSKPVSRRTNVCERRRYRLARARGEELGAITSLHPAAPPLLKFVNVTTAVCFADTPQCTGDFSGAGRTPMVLVHERGEMLEYRMVPMCRAVMVEPPAGEDAPVMCQLQLKGGVTAIVDGDTLIYLR
ncbi:hypothetical protein [Noviherbaspirillum pedocola]|uniref:Uncharacterized protein n=1 Tax=Noviherbaspirillum pedocola TaxID=2801341 RepID=A0A934SV63_9BURK|nr:hypothetical protein [Noviherbaspirillum pedocola]MBK4736174.1 hypothetical protein [Noviherbaspirillum pedocola]